MADELSRLAEQSGLDLDSAKTALGGILSFFQEKLGNDTFARVREAIPDSGELLSKFQAAEGDSGGGLLGNLTGMAGKVLGEQTQDASDLFQKLTRTGLSMEQIRDFLPKALAWLQSKVPPEILAQIQKQLPNLQG